VPQGEFEAKWIAFSSRSSGDRLSAMGVLDPAGTVIPINTGVTMEIGDSTGRVVYRITVPPSAFKSNPSRRSFRLDSRRARQLRADGLTRLNMLVTSDGTVRVYLKARSREFGAEFPKGYSWTVMFGDQCGVSECFLRPRHSHCG
jgi:hypothetical protein